MTTMQEFKRLGGGYDEFMMNFVLVTQTLITGLIW